MAAAQTLLADEVTARIGPALREAEIDSVLLRGPSLSRHLYSPCESRDYTDVDLLVPPESTSAAGRVLESLGFVAIGEELPGDRPAWARVYLRNDDGGNVDLHRTLVGAEAGPETVWAALRAHAVPIEVGGRTLCGLDAEAAALVVTLHAAQHGAGASKQLDDLSRALERLTYAQWQGARDLAGRVEATTAFAAGLRLVTAGVSLAERLELPDESSTEVLLRAGGSPPLALGFAWLSQTEGLAPKLRLIAGKIFPGPNAVRAWAPFARRGSLHLVAAYAWRPIWLLRHVVPGYRAWASAQRLSRGSAESGQASRFPPRPNTTKGS